jgi:hypothetical protein
LGGSRGYPRSTHQGKGDQTHYNRFGREAMHKSYANAAGRGEPNIDITSACPS